MTRSVDYYTVLGVGARASAQEIKDAYRYRVQILHPDRLMNAPESVRLKAEKELIRVNQAYAVLSDTGRRAQYDAEGVYRYRQHETTGAGYARHGSSTHSTGGQTRRSTQESSTARESQWPPSGGYSSSPQARNWFERHLNWTYLLGSLFPFWYLSSLTASEALTSAQAFWFLATIVAYLATTGWVLRQKERSLGWMLALPIPLLGPFIPYVLSNEKAKRLHGAAAA